mmetsp:Transcript_1696/g.2269  ORF Transcript_1696/g.2269 Transcript_1696/m.2269 type:complete len:901 (-) Transcript_1696:89-2791(-)
MSQMRGLTNFITQIRACKNKSEEKDRVLKEMSNIRSKFQKGTRLGAYSRRKYTWKIIYIYMLGYEIDIGHMEAMQLCASKTYSEKKTGYCACQVLFNEKHDLLTMLTQPVKNDLSRDTPEHIQALAMTLVSNIGSKTMADTLWKDVADILTRGSSRSSIRKKASLCMLKMVRKAPENIEVEVIAPRVISMIADQDFGVALCAVTLMIGLVSMGPNPLYNEAIPNTIRVLYKLVTKNSNSGTDFSGYYYFNTISPWLQIKCLRLLQYFPAPQGDSKKRLDESLLRILKHETKRVKSGSSSQKKNKTNADHGILFECMNLIIYYEQTSGGEAEEKKSNYRDHLDAMAKLLGRFISLKEANVRYLGLDAMTRLAKIEGMGQKISQQMTTILFSLRKDQDASIRKRALDLLFVICSKENSRKITQELLSFLKVADYKIREELVLKIAILAERFATDLRWYLDVILNLITVAGDYVSDDIWYRAIQIVTNNEQLQKYAALTMSRALKNKGLHENGIKVGSYILGEFSDLVAETKSGEQLFESIHQHFETATSRTKALLLSSYIKLCNSFPDLQSQVLPVFSRFSVHADEELQQRACEYKTIIGRERKLLEDVFELMPAYENAESLDAKVKVRSKKAVSEAGATEDDDENEDEDEDENSEEEDDDEEIDLPDQDDETFDAILAASNSGVLYKSESLQIGVKMISGISQEMKMKLFYGNKSDYALENLTVSFKGPDALDIQQSPNQAFTVNPKEQKAQYLRAICMKPFSEIPEMTVSCTIDGEEHDFSVKLPILMHQFISPYQMDAGKFKENWGKFEGGEAREVISGIDGKELTLKVPEIFHMHKVDIAASAIPLVGIFNASKDGRVIKLPVMGSLAVKNGNCQVIFRSKHQSVSQNLLAAFKTIFA